MRNRFDRQLVQLNNELIEMGGMIEKAISDTVKALVNQDIELASNVIEYDEEIDHQEREIEQLCLKLLLQQQPVAKDLRLISAALKMITDMERIGDHATDISEITIELSKESYIKKLDHIQQMAKETMVSRYAAGTAGAGCAGRGGAYGDDLKPARALLHALPSGAAGAAHHGRSGKAVRPTAQNGGSAGLPRQKDAGAADFAKRPHTL